MRSFSAALAFALVLGTNPVARAADIVAPSSLPITQTVVTLAAGVDAILGTATSRRYLCLMNIGTGLVNLGFDAPAAASAGWALEGASDAGHQGGAMCWENSIVAAGVVHAISAAGSTVVVLEGR
jgi:hypothetical protein